MCGINGVWSTIAPGGPGVLSRFRESLKALSHRGPDGCGEWLDEEVGIYLGHRRLAILDLSPLGSQPMISQSGRYKITFNGEIYNYLEIQKRLTSQGCEFRGSSDTEVMLALFDRYGIGAVSELRGMFAFALYDSEDRVLVLCRDPIGKKPLYYSSTKNFLCFASEIPALTMMLEHPLSINASTLCNYLELGFCQGPQTIYNGIQEVPPGAFMVFAEPSRAERRIYSKINFHQKYNEPEHEIQTQLEYLLSESVRLRLRSDVPVGVFLSGGIDSGLVTAFAAQQSSQPINTFTVGFRESVHDERELALAVSKKYGTFHREIELTSDIVDVIPRIAASYGEPFGDPSAIPSYLISQETARHVKVVLTGDGGDEIFFGYRRHIAAHIVDKIHSVLGAGPARFIATLIPMAILKSQVHRGASAFAYRMLRVLRARTREESLRILSTDGFDLSQMDTLLKYKVHQESSFYSYNDSELLAGITQWGILSELPDDLLVKMDIATMSHGLEARSPFLDYELVQWAMSLSSSTKLDGVSTKPILRNLAKKFLPPELILAPKRGFEIPLNEWLNGKLKAMSEDVLLSKSGIIAQYFKRDTIESLLRGKMRKSFSVGQWSNNVWRLLMLGIWFETVQKGNKDSIRSI